MVEYNPGAERATLIVVDDVEGTITIDGVEYPHEINSGMMQVGHVQGEPPFVRLHTLADTVRRITASGATTYEQGVQPFFDPDYEPDE